MYTILLSFILYLSVNVYVRYNIGHIAQSPEPAHAKDNKLAIFVGFNRAWPNLISTNSKLHLRP